MNPPELPSQWPAQRRALTAARQGRTARALAAGAAAAAMRAAEGARA